jgi:hypothetical protein
MNIKFDKILDEMRENDNTDVSVVWGSITGILTNQTDLQNTLNLKLDITDFNLSIFDTGDLSEGSNLYFTNARAVTAMAGLYEVPLTFSTGLTRTANTITNNLSTGITGGQTVIGGTGVTDILKLQGTTGNGTLTSPAIQFLVGNNGARVAGTILNNRNWGIGTTSPASTLHLSNSVYQSNILTLQSTPDAADSRIGIHFLVHDNVDGTTIENVRQGSANRYALSFSTPQKANALFISDSLGQEGNVGIGTTTPSGKLEINGNTGDRMKGLIIKDVEAGIVLRSTDTGGHDINLFSAGSGSSVGVGGFAFFDNTAVAYRLSVTSGGNVGIGVANAGTAGLAVMNGNVGIGTTAPTAKLTIAAGTATANTAPLKFTSGTNLTTAEAGAMEYNNTFHLTNSDATRRHIVLAPNTTKVTAGAPYTNDGYVVMNIGGTDFKIMTKA